MGSQNEQIQYTTTSGFRGEWDIIYIYIYIYINVITYIYIYTQYLYDHYIYIYIYIDMVNEARIGSGADQVLFQLSVCLKWAPRTRFLRNWL